MSTITPLVAPHRITCEDVNYEVSGDYECAQPASYLYTRVISDENDLLYVHICQTCHDDFYSKN